MHWQRILAVIIIYLAAVGLADSVPERHKARIGCLLGVVLAVLVGVTLARGW